MPTLTLTLAEVALLRAALDAVPTAPGAMKVAGIIAKLDGANTPKMPAARGPVPGTGKHQRCVHHEPVASPVLTTPVLCFDVKPKPADIKARLALVAAIEKSAAKYHAAYMKRPAPIPVKFKAKRPAKGGPFASKFTGPRGTSRAEAQDAA